MPNTLRILGDFPNHHSRQAGIRHELSDHGKGKDPLIFAKLRQTNVVVMRNGDGGGQVGQSADDPGRDPHDSVLDNPLGLLH